MDEGLERAIQELCAAEEEMTLGHEGPNAQPIPWSDKDPDDEFYTAAFQVIHVYRALKKGKPLPLPMQTGIKFTLQADGSTRMTPE